MSERKIDWSEWGDRAVAVLPYVILLIAVYQMAMITDGDEIQLQNGLQALFLALAAIFLKLDLRDRSAKQERTADLKQSYADKADIEAKRQRDNSRHFPTQAPEA